MAMVLFTFGKRMKKNKKGFESFLYKLVAPSLFNQNKEI